MGTWPSWAASVYYTSLKMLPFTRSGPRQYLPAMCFHPSTGGDSFLERGLGGPQRSTSTVSLENWDDLLSFWLFVAILLLRTSRFLANPFLRGRLSFLRISIWSLQCSIRFAILTSFKLFNSLQEPFGQVAVRGFLHLPSCLGHWD